MDDPVAQIFKVSSSCQCLAFSRSVHAHALVTLPFSSGANGLKRTPISFQLPNSLSHLIMDNSKLALLFPADGRIPHLVDLTTSTVTTTDARTGRPVTYRMPHPQVHMNYIATNTTNRVWDSRVRERSNPCVIGTKCHSRLSRIFLMPSTLPRN